jgi:hypothetical protein
MGKPPKVSEEGRKLYAFNIFYYYIMFSNHFSAITQKSLAETTK